MTFSEIVRALSQRQFVSRFSWKGHSVLVFGMDNVGHLVGQEHKRIWHPTLADLRADDWFELPYLWDGPSDDQKPFERRDPTLESLRRDASCPRRS